MTRWTDSLAKKAGVKVKKASWNKGQPTVVDGIQFPSMLEAAVYCELKLWTQSREYENLRCQVIVPIAGDLKLKVDFVIHNKKRGCDEAHEAKGKEFPTFVAKKQAWRGTAPMDLFIWAGEHTRPRILKVIRGKNG